MSTFTNELDEFRDQCGVVGIFGKAQASHHVYLALHALQHRGQDSAGIVAYHEGRYHREVGMGLVSDVFNENNLDLLPGSCSIGHVRYTTAGQSNVRDAQPIACKTGNGYMAIAHNGNLIDGLDMRERLESDGAIFHTQSDTEVICHLFAQSRAGHMISCLRDALAQVRGAYSLCMIVQGKLIGARDPYGIRPLVLGKLDQGYVLASEDCSFSLIDAEFVREIEPGEMVVIDHEGVRSIDLINRDVTSASPCVFEHIYFARPDSHVFGRSVFDARKCLGRELAKIAPTSADVVIAVPDSGVISAMGYAEEARLPYNIGLVRNHYVGRTFIEPQEKIRHFGVRLKLSPVKEVIKNQRIVVVDDSIVRGTTSKKIVSILRGAGAKEIHMRISAPMTTNPCYYGIATPTKKELLAANATLVEMMSFLQVDSLAFLTRDAMYRALAHDGKCARMCDACFTGHYPVA